MFRMHTRALRSLGVALLPVLSGGLVSAGATQIPPGPVSGVWAAAGSPYEVLGDIYVPSGAHLEVQAGAAVVFQGLFRLTVQGTLAALGNAGQPVTLDGVVRWRGLRFESPDLTSTLHRCEIRNAEQGVASIDSPVDVEACLLAGHVVAVHIFGVGDVDPPAVRIDGCTIRDCQQHGIFVVENSNTVITGCEITQCALDGSPRGAVQLSNQSAQGNNDPLIHGNWIHNNVWQGLTAFDVTGAGRIRPQVTDNTIEYNYTGIYLLYTSGSFQHNQINHNFQAGNPNSGAGVMVYGSTSHPVFTNNTTTGNYTGYYIVQGATANLGDLNNVDPNDDGGNLIYGNLDPGGLLWSVYNMSAADITAENNLWDSEDPGVIAQTIHDHYDDPSCGIVDFDPLLPAAGADPGAIAGLGPIHGRVSSRPNPCRGSVELMLSVPEESAGMALLAVHDLEGRLVRELLHAPLSAGEHRLAWDGLDAAGMPVPGGVYFCRLACGGQPVVTHALLLRR
jgi:hypothetical protein